MSGSDERVPKSHEEQIDKVFAVKGDPVGFLRRLVERDYQWWSAQAQAHFIAQKIVQSQYLWLWVKTKEYE